MGPAAPWRACAFVAGVAIALGRPCAAQPAAGTGAASNPAPAESSLGGPSSVGGQLKSDMAAREVGYRFEGLSPYFVPYYEFKARVKESTALDFGADYNLLYQYATQSLGKDQASGGVFRFYGTWTLLNRGTANEGALTYKIENRHNLWTPIAPKALASQVGYAGLTAVPFSDAGWLLTNLFWHQSLFENRVAFVAGIVDTTDYVDVYGLVNPWADFSNLAFSTDPTIPAPDQGLGFALRGSITDQIYVVAGLADGNGDPANPQDAFDSFFDTGEYFEHVELGWVSSFENRMQDNVHVTAWRSDARSAAGVPAGNGVAFSASKLFGDRWLPFLRLGYSDGGGGVPLERSISAGAGYFTRHKTELLGFGLNWGRPSEETYGPDARDQVTAELFYRLQLFPHMAITLDAQYIVNPALNTQVNDLWAIGVRTRFSF